MPGLLLDMLGPLAVWAADCSSLRGFARVAPWSAWPPSCGGQSLLPCRPPAERRAGGALSIILAGSAPGCAPPATVGTSASSFVSGLRACDVSRGLLRAPPGSFVRGSWLPTGLWLAGPLTLCPYWLLRARHSPSRVLPFEPIPALLGGPRRLLSLGMPLFGSLGGVVRDGRHWWLPHRIRRYLSTVAAVG